ncbi:MAG TPA: Gfo/Idh/MocA family oxidoreductase [Bryobacteraceae bacterium]|nr:Gfo/Idh/MocA family oxidoreductase [Bryobacteraceae bacterium]
MPMQRRTFAQALAASALPAQDKRVAVALLTHEAAPHLGAYLEGLAKTEEVSSVYLADAGGKVEPSARKALGAKLAGAYRSPKELFAIHKPQMALVTMEAALAPPAITAALGAGCDVLAEKPACTNLADFEVLVEKARQARRSLVLALANRVDPLLLEAKRVVESGAIGKPYGLDLQMVADQTRLTRPAYHKTWVAQKKRAGGGHLIWLGIHWLDLAMYLTNSRIREVAGFTANVGGQPLDTEDAAVVALRFDNGALGTLTSGYYLDRSYHSLVKIWGSEGWLAVQKHTHKPPLEWYSRGEMHKFEGPAVPAGYTEFVRAIARASAGLDPWPLTVDDSLYVLKTVFAAYRAAESGRTQSV